MEGKNEEIKSEKCKSNKVFVIVIVVIAMVLTFGCGMILGHKLGDNKKDKKDKPNGNEVVDNNQGKKDNENVQLDIITGKHSFSEYCPSTGSCKKDIGMITINNQNLKLSVDINNINTEDINGYISLGLKQIDVSKQGSNKSLDGFEIYNDYFIIYTSNLDYEFYNYTCGDIKDLKYYTIILFNADLNKIIDAGGITPNNAFIDTKIEDNHLYFYSAGSNDASSLDILYYDKISFTDFLEGKYDTNSHITISEKKCR